MLARVLRLLVVLISFTTYVSKHLYYSSSSEDRRAEKVYITNCKFSITSNWVNFEDFREKWQLLPRFAKMWSRPTVVIYDTPFFIRTKRLPNHVQ